MQDYKDLLIWKRGLEFVKLVYQVTALFPQDERFGMTSQLRRSSVSVLANIVEGRGKRTDKDFLRFLYISKGSLNESQCYIELALELHFIDQKQFEILYNKSNEMSYLLNKFMRRLSNPPEPASH